MTSRTVRSTITLVATGCLLLGGCAGDDPAPAGSGRSAGGAAASSGRQFQAGGLGFDVPAGREEFDVADANPGNERAQEVAQQLAQIGARVGAVAREDTGAGEATVVTYQLPVAGTSVEGSSILLQQGEEVVTLTVSTLDRDRSDATTETILSSLVDS